MFCAAHLNEVVCLSHTISDAKQRAVLCGSTYRRRLTADRGKFASNLIGIMDRWLELEVLY